EVDPRLNAFKSNLLLRLTDSGLLIQIIDSQDRPMFKLGSKKPEEYMVHILQALTPVFNDIPNRLTLTGHTDSIPFANGEVGYSNWELSSDRANESRQVLVNSGLHRDKVLQVIGMASNMGTDETQPDSALDRRMTILVVSKSKENQILLDDSIIRHVA
ncbi:motility protein MotB, partial [Salmonella enterica subsp. enterica serovar Offa]|nr:motility protein MotB [Salmonella enterica subsp. enterica serovar Offa]